MSGVACCLSQSIFHHSASHHFHPPFLPILGSAGQCGPSSVTPSKDLTVEVDARHVSEREGLPPPPCRLAEGSAEVVAVGEEEGSVPTAWSAGGGGGAPFGASSACVFGLQHFG